MPDGKSITFQANEYPQLEGLPDQSKIKLEIMGTLTTDENGGGTITFDKVDIETEGMADRELSSMSKQNMSMMAESNKGGGDDF